MMIFFLLCLSGDSQVRDRMTVYSLRDGVSHSAEAAASRSGGASGFPALLSAHKVSITGKSSEIFTKKSPFKILKFYFSKNKIK